MKKVMVTASALVLAGMIQGTTLNALATDTLVKEAATSKQTGATKQSEAKVNTKTKKQNNASTEQKDQKTETSKAHTVTSQQSASKASVENEKTETTKESSVIEGNRPMGSAAKTVSPLRLLRSNLLSTDSTLPRKDVVDVASWQSWMTLSDYKLLEAQGVKGIVVKLTEGTFYKNPYASQQISYAKQAGLVVSTYHYSHFNTKAEAVKEADYYAAQAAALGLPKTTVMINDCEDADITKKGADPTATSKAFADELAKLGYSNVAHYSSLSWIGEGNYWLEPSKLGGMKKMWVAQYPTRPLASNLLNTTAAAWQYASTVQFIGASSSNTLDVSIDYIGLFTKAQGQGFDIKNYYTSNPKKIGLIKNINEYSDVDLKHTVKSLKSGTIKDVVGIEYAGKYPRLKLSDGNYITANKSYVVKPISNLSDYYTSGVSKVGVVPYKGEATYNTPNLNTGKKVQPEGTVLTVKGYSFSTGGTPRLNTNKGYVTASKKYVTKVTNSIGNYVQARPYKIGVKKNMTLYANKELTKKVKTVSKGSIYTPSSISYASGYPRFKVSGGYLSASKDYVVGLSSNIIKYLQRRSGTVTTKTSVYVYSNTAFSKKVRKLSKGTKLTIKGLDFSGSVPRIKVSGGYITANKSYVK